MPSVADNSSACFQAAASSILFNAFAMAAFDAAVRFIQWFSKVLDSRLATLLATITSCRHKHNNTRKVLAKVNSNKVCTPINVQNSWRIRPQDYKNDQLPKWHCAVSWLMPVVSPRRCPAFLRSEPSPINATLGAGSEAQLCPWPSWDNDIWGNPKRLKCGAWIKQKILPNRKMIPHGTKQSYYLLPIFLDAGQDCHPAFANVEKTP